MIVSPLYSSILRIDCAEWYQSLESISSCRAVGRWQAYHGTLTDQFKKTAANPRSITSVMTELPFLNSMPPMAGSKANANGAECHTEES